MLKNYLLVAFRNLWKHKVYSLINILGLAVGFCCCLLITFFIAYELNYDHYHSNSDRIYRVTRDFLNQDGEVDLHLGHVAPPIGPLLKDEFPEVEEALRMTGTTELFRIDDKIFTEEDGYFAEENLFKVFDFEVIKGNANEMLKRPFSIALSEDLAKKYFADQDAIGKVIQWTIRGQQYSLKVTGVFKELPEQSHFHPHYLLSFKTLENPAIYQNGPDPSNHGKEGLKRNWGNNSFLTYVLLPKEHDAAALEAKFPAFMEKTFGAFARSHGWVKAEDNLKVDDFTHLYLQKLTDIHLHSQLDTEAETNGNILYIYIFALIGVFILAIGSINFINLSTARSANRAKEVGIRKVVGAYRYSLVRQFLSESVLVTSISMLVALGLVEIFRPWLSEFLGRSLTVSYFTYWYIPIVLLGIVVTVGLLAGFYPAIYLSSFKPVTVLKGKISSGAKRSRLRTVLVVTQFTISIILMISTIIIYQQLSFMKNKDLGFDKDHIINLPLPAVVSQKFESFRHELKKNPAIKEVSRSSRIPSGRLLDSFGTAEVELKDSIIESKVILKVVGVDHYFLDTYGVELAAGRNFSKKFGTDDSTAFVINETARKLIGWESADEAVNKRFNYADRKGKLVGIIKDFNFESMHEEMKPLVFAIENRFFRNLSVKLQGSNIREGLAHVEGIWSDFAPDSPFEYEFLDENFARLYEAEEREGALFFTFAGLAIFIACLGLFGLASFIAEQRSKEIGIRKVLGASIGSILTLMSSGFVKLVLLANVIAIPFAVYAMNLWLQDFAYRVSMNVFIFLITGGIALLIALLTISIQVLKVARVNPVNVLRNE